MSSLKLPNRACVLRCLCKCSEVEDNEKVWVKLVYTDEQGFFFFLRCWSCTPCIDVGFSPHPPITNLFQLGVWMVCVFTGDVGGDGWLVQPSLQAWPRPPRLDWQEKVGRGWEDHHYWRWAGRIPGGLQSSWGWCCCATHLCSCSVWIVMLEWHHL